MVSAALKKTDSDSLTVRRLRIIGMSARYEWDEEGWGLDKAGRVFGVSRLLARRHVHVM